MSFFLCVFFVGASGRSVVSEGGEAATMETHRCAGAVEVKVAGETGKVAVGMVEEATAAEATVEEETAARTSCT